MALLDSKQFPPLKISLVVGLALSLTAGQLVPSAQRHDEKASVPPEYVCLDTVVKATAPDGDTIFLSLQVKPGQCESAVMPSPLPREDRDLLHEMSVAASNVAELYLADQIRETGGEERTWTPMIETVVKNFRGTRIQLCSRHHHMFVYQLNGDGKRAAPVACSKE
jgi:hypothetical protein